ncbi:MAG: hypothetical protein ACPLXC_01600 [Candidatus Pacearchaeota archaeon]
MKGIMFTIGILVLILIAIISVLLLNSTIESPITMVGMAGSSLFDKPSPANWIQEKDIIIYPDRVVIMVENATLSRYANTKSMDPLIDINANGIEIKPNSPQDIHVGDIIAYETHGNFIVHRVIRTGIDEQGWYCIVKGDNSALPDETKVRFEQIRYITIVIIY